MSEDFMDNIGESNPGEKHGLKELPKGEYMVEVLSCDKKPTADGKGTNIRMSVRVCQKPWANRRAWGRWFVQSSDSTKQKGARAGAAMFDEVLTACGYIMAKDESAKSKLAIEMGMAKKFDKADFKLSDLVGKFMICDVEIPPKKDPANPDEGVFPKIVRGKMIDPADYVDMVKTVVPKKEKKEEVGTDQPPF